MIVFVIEFLYMKRAAKILWLKPYTYGIVTPHGSSMKQENTYSNH